jgi:hypothetical protein
MVTIQYRCRPKKAQGANPSDRAKGMEMVIEIEQNFRLAESRTPLISTCEPEQPAIAG